MAQVTLRINGYAYTLGCKDGEEKHLEAMGAEVSRRVEGVRTAAGPSGEARMLVMAALLMADDLFETRTRLQTAEAALQQQQAEAATLRQEVERAQQQVEHAQQQLEHAPQQPQFDPMLSQKLNRMAKRAEEIAEGLEHP